MAAKQLQFDEAARHALLRGMEKLSKAVKATLGPAGRNVILDKKYGSPTITKDGVTVAKEIELEDPYENMGAQLVREVASKTSDVAGDGTTTATVLAEAIFREGLKNVTAGANPMNNAAPKMPVSPITAASGTCPSINSHMTMKAIVTAAPIFCVAQRDSHANSTRPNAIAPKTTADTTSTIVVTTGNACAFSAMAACPNARLMALTATTT